MIASRLRVTKVADCSSFLTYISRASIRQRRGVSSRYRTARRTVFLSQLATSRGVQVVVCVGLLICVLTVVVAPEVDLLPTVLREHRIASFWSDHQAVLALVFAVRFPRTLSRFESVVLCEEAFQAIPSRLSITCARLC